MLKKIGFENFKAFGSFREFELGNLNLIAGKNSSGKSSIYQALFLLAQSTGRYLEDKNKNRLPFLKFNGSLVKLGRTNEVLFNTEKKQLTFMLEWTDGMRVDCSFSKHEGETIP